MQAGDRVLREVWFGKVWRVNPVRIVEETAERAVLHSPPGSIALYPVDEAGKEVRIPRPDGWTLAARTTLTHALVLLRPEARHSLWLFWGSDGEFSHWYVNFERPMVPTPLGWDYQDDKLDLIVGADGSVRWKDEDELAEAAARGLVDEREVRAEAARVLADPPWPTGWEDWRAEATTPPPELPPGWDVVAG
jgi:predicted RNA-binding protein associated with RNAse of E/G family